MDHCGGGWGGIITLKIENYSSLHVYFAVQILPFIDWTHIAVPAAEECGATAEMTLSLQVDLELSNVAATSEP